MTLDRRAFVLAALSAGLPASARGQAAPEVIFVRASANGRPGRFLVDTGAPGTVLDIGFARAIGAELGERRILRGEGGRGAVAGLGAYDIDMQASGGPRIVLDPAATDLTPFSHATAQPVDGILGSDYFGRLVLELDYRSGGCAFRDPARPAPPHALPVRILHTPFVRGTAEHAGRRLVGSFQIDTGSNTAVQLHAPVARRYFPGVRGHAVPTLGIAGRGQSLMAPLDRLEAAGLVLERAMTDFADELRPDDAPSDYVGLLGGPAFAGKVLTIDYTRARLWLG